MVKNDLYQTVPSFFKCPISLDVMKCPVSLSTGVTYDRSSIQKWLDCGNNTCPATMQVLHTKDFVPNHTLHRLIQIWSDSLALSSSTPPAISHDQARHLIFSSNCSDSVSKILDFATESEDNRKFLANTEGIVPIIAGVLGNVDADPSTFEYAVRILDLVLIDYTDKEQLMRSILKGDHDFLSSIVQVLHIGSLDSQIASATILEAIAVDAESKLLIAEKDGVVPGLLRLVSSNSDSTAAMKAGLSCLVAVSIPRRIRLQIVRLGAVQVLGKLLSRPDSTTVSVSVSDNAFKLLEMVSTCNEGRTAICEDRNCIPAIAQKMLKVSKQATEHAVLILWSVCHLFRDQKAQEAVTKSNGLTKILLLMQSNCSPSVRQMSTDLLKIFRVNSKSCLSGYDTKTTHIMPF